MPHKDDWLNVLLEREGTTSPSGWDSFVGEDCEDGDASEWYAWNGTTASNAWDAKRRSCRVEASNSTADATRAIVGDNASNTGNPNDAPWGAGRRCITWAAARKESGALCFDVLVDTDAGAVRIAYDCWSHSPALYGTDLVAIGLGDAFATVGKWEVML